jgi:hypothetical protein
METTRFDDKRKSGCPLLRALLRAKKWVSVFAPEDRLHALADIFAVSLWAYAVMSNHLHVVVQVVPEVAASWSDREVADRWVRLFPREDLNPELRVDVLSAHADRIALLRARLSDLSWFMRCLSEPIARRANQEDRCTGRFWEGRFRCQALLDDTAVLAALAYVDLNPVRAGMCDTLEASDHTSAKARLQELEQQPYRASFPLAALSGIRGHAVLRMSQSEYLRLLDFTGRQIRAGKRGAISGQIPTALRRLGRKPEQWQDRVLATGSGFQRAMGEVDSLIEKAKAMGQNWLRGIGTARRLALPSH